MHVTEIELTQDDIDKGEPESCQRCPVSLAIARHFDIIDHSNVSTTNESVVIWAGIESCIMTKYAHDAADFIQKFDLRLAVEPRTVKLKRVAPFVT